jgi:hypothetical protein
MKPLVRFKYVKSRSELELSRAGASRRALDEEARNTTYWRNDLYHVARRVFPESPLVQLNIRRRDGRPIFRDWRHFQAIKNQLVGEECEGIELYPAESRLVDTSNKYHLWCHTDSRFRFPVGFDYRDLKDADPKRNRLPGLRQRKLGAPR